MRYDGCLYHMAHLHCLIVELIEIYVAQFLGCLDYIFALFLQIDFIHIVEAQ